jgi:hypothetical protein
MFRSALLRCEELENLALPSAALPADFPATMSVVESFEGLVAGANNPKSAGLGEFSPGAASTFTFNSGIALTTPVPNPDPFSNGVVIGDWSQGSANFSLGANGTITSAANLPNGNAYLFVDASASASGPVGFTFPADVGAVGAYVTGNGGTSVTLRAYDAAGTLLETATIPAASRTLWTAKDASAFLGIKHGNIRRVEFSGDFLAMDLLQTRATSPTLVGTPQFATGADAGGAARVNQYKADGSLQYSLDAFPGFTGGVRVSEADFNGDGTPDLVVGTGPGTPAKISVIDGVTHKALFTSPVFEGFTGGVFVVAGDLTGDDVPDVVLTPDEGGGPRVLIIRGGDFTTVASFLGIQDPSFRGGARAAIGDMNGDGRMDLAVSAGFGGGPRVTAYDGTTVTTSPVKLFNDFFIFEPALRNGAYLAIGDVDGDGFGDLIAGAGPGGAPRVLALSGSGLIAGQGDKSPVLMNFFAGDTANRNGIRVTAKNLDGDLQADIVTGGGAGSGSQTTAYLGKNFTGGGANSTLAFNAFPGFTGGVFVG